MDTSKSSRGESPTAEKAASVVVAIGYVFILYQAVLAGLPQLLLGIVAVSVIFSVWLEKSPANPTVLRVHWQWILRENSGKGIWCCLLVPTAVIVSSFKNSTVDDREAMLLMFCVAMMIMSLLTCETATNKPMMAECEATETDSEDECICIAAVSLLERRYVVLFIGILVFYGLIVFRLTMFQYGIICLFMLLMAEFLILVPRLLPHSFTMGENVICTQAFILFLLGIWLGKSPPKSVYNVQEITAAEVVAFMQVAVLSCIIVVCTVTIFPQCRAVKHFFFLLVSVAMAISLPLFYWHLGQNFILWLVHYISQSMVKQRLFAFWSACCIAAIAIVYVNSQRIKWSVAAAKRKSDTTPTNDRSGEHKPAQKTDDRPGEQEPAKNTDRPGEHDPAQNTDNRPGEHDPAQNTDDNVAQQRNVSILARKQFHVLMLCVFLPGLIFHTEMLTLASSCALGVFIIAECIHMWRIPPVGDLLHKWLQVFVDDRDKGVVLLTPLYLLTGLALPLWLHPIGSGMALSLYSGVLSIGLGDMMAAVVGSKCGNHRWPGMKKTVEGTIASVVVQLLVVWIIFHLGVCPQIGWLQVTVAVVLTSLLEAFTSQIDNLVLPLFMYNLLAL